MSVIKRNGIYLIDIAKINGISLATIAKINGQTLARSYVSTYPPAHSDTYVKATSKQTTDFWPYYATDPAKSLVGNYAVNSWVCVAGTYTNQRFHIDLGSPKIIRRIYYENMHNSGAWTQYGVKNFTFWGSADDANGATAFADLVYSHDTYWTQLTTAQSTFDQHPELNQADPNFILVTNNAAYRYYAFKFADNWAGSTFMGVRRIELQVIG